jgi:hypothetical protein
MNAFDDFNNTLKGAKVAEPETIAELEKRSSG